MATRLVAAAHSEKDWALYWALAAAAWRGHSMAIQQLIAGRAPNPFFLDGTLRAACQSGSVEAVRACCVLRAADAQAEEYFVRAAARREEGDAVTWLRVVLEGGTTDPAAWNGVVWDVCNGRGGYRDGLPIVRALLQACRGRGILNLERALRAAVREDRDDIVRLLLEEGARVEGLDADDLQSHAEFPDGATRKMLEAAGVDFGGVNAATATAAREAYGRGMWWDEDCEWLARIGRRSGQ